MKMRISHPHKENVSIHFGHFTQITGQDRQLKYYVWQLLLWYFDGKKYRYEDLSLFHQEEPLIFQEDEVVKRSEFNIISIANIKDLIAQMDYKKGTVAFDYLKIKFNHLKIIEQVDSINDTLLQISGILNQELDLELDAIRYHTESIDFTSEQIISKNFLPYFEMRGDNVSFEFIDNKTKFLLFLEMLALILEHSTEKVLLLLRNVDSYLNYSDFTICCEKIQELYQRFPHFYVINFPSNDHYIYANCENVSYINIFSDLIAHYYDFSFMYERFIEHYPSNNFPSEEDFLASLQRNASYLFTTDLNYHQFSIEDMVAIKVLNELYHYGKRIDFRVPETDPLLLHYLTED